MEVPYDSENVGVLVLTVTSQHKGHGLVSLSVSS